MFIARRFKERNEALGLLPRPRSSASLGAAARRGAAVPPHLSLYDGRRVRVESLKRAGRVAAKSEGRGEPIARRDAAETNRPADLPTIIVLPPRRLVRHHSATRGAACAHAAAAGDDGAARSAARGRAARGQDVVRIRLVVATHACHLSVSPGRPIVRKIGSAHAYLRCFATSSAPFILKWTKLSLGQRSFNSRLWPSRGSVPIHGISATASRISLPSPRRGRHAGLGHLGHHVAVAVDADEAVAANDSRLAADAYREYLPALKVDVGDVTGRG